MLKIVEKYSLKPHNTFGIDARCRRFVEYSSVSEACEVARLIREGSDPLLIIGGGSNLLLTKDFDGLVVHSTLQGVSALVQGDDVIVTAGSGGG